MNLYRRYVVPRRGLPLRWVALISVLSCWGVAADAAGHYYQWTQADGTPMFSNLPPPPSVRDYVVHDLREWSLIQPKPRLVTGSNLQARGLLHETESPDADVALARQHLQAALRAQATGRTPLPGERQHLVNGHSRLRSSYFERQRDLDAAVAEATDELQLLASAEP